MLNPPLILGSSSPFRKMLLERLQVNFTTESPAIDETPLTGESPIALVERLAVEKAQKIAEQHHQGLIIGSDQVAMHGAEIVGKPNTHERAVEQLRTASGKSIKLYTGLALINAHTGNIQSEVVPFTVHFKPLSDEIIERYLRKEQPYNCAGSVKSEGLGVALFERFDGDDPNALIGLPLIRLVSMLEAEGYDLYA
ncbi:Maf-like protein YceF [Arenicella chitinivorans]|uniref:7-methyl-GTP pyrophosphatase n=1 Tax=Arenicella chitinivorans TaxID=1329800 RepID=A0A918RH99_9GAMM|nr:nucleoside triphosphate pyrophosphatase [Arenicella chitinivorans]GGZ99131.1 Maf-like protein YceF [Arenicella chitinivorans]